LTQPRPILKVGLTGGIASGKTTILAILAELGAFVLNADELAHEITAPGGSAHAELLARFGPEYFERDGTVRRRELGNLVFHDREARLALNAIVHPKVIAEVARRIDRYRISGRSPVAVVDAALLVESGAVPTFDRIVVTRCSREAQMQRLMARAGLAPEEALARIDSQASLEEKLAVAHYVIDTDVTLRETRQETERVWSRLLADYERLYGDPGTRTPAPS
jgi:dephospho-CoA kinase